MTTKQRQEFKTRLIEERELIVKTIHDQEDEEKNFQREGDDGYDASAEVLEKLTDSETKLVKKIDLALERIKNGAYGTCLDCEAEIPLSRLEAKPSVSLCRDCQGKHEIK